jgi:hypothetical protein
MFCPSCHTEYRSGFTRCADCGVALIAALPLGPSTESGKEDILELAWRGTDLIAYSLLLPALEEAGIPFYEKKTSYHLVHAIAFGGLVGGRPGYEVWVWQSALERVQALLAAMTQSLPADAGAPQAGYFDDDQTLFHAHVPSAWGPEEATESIWSGADLEFADKFSACLFENSIECRTNQDSDGGVRVAVRPRDRSRAREILRQIDEAAPPR